MRPNKVPGIIATGIRSPGLGLSLALVCAFVALAGPATAEVPAAVTETKNNEFGDAAAKKAFEVKMVIKEATTIYSSMKLNRTGLNQKAFEYAWRGYHNLLKTGQLKKSYVLTVCDFTQSSAKKRMYVIDVMHKKLLFNTYVSHGMNSGIEYATSFSNRANSFKSSLGFFVTSKTYFGRNGLSLKVRGLEKGYNDLAAKRHIVLHGSDYITPEYLKDNGEMGRSLGCAAMPNVMSPKIIKTIKNGSCLFIYHPTTNYLTHSNIING